ncbi:MAG: ABC transporter ATP-binding protein [Candidatus Hodarchaeota archaeon]
MTELNKNSEIVNCKDIHKTFVDGSRKIEVLKGVNLEIKRGELVAIVGTSGCGKTTLLNVLSTLDRPTSGRVFIDGQELTNLNESQLTNIRLSKIGMVFQDFYLIPVLSALENIQVPLIFANVSEKERLERSAELLDLVDMRDHADHRPNELSGGQRQRISIARAMANDPVIVFADEPTGNLDSVTGAKIIALFRGLVEKHNKSILMVTHDSEAASKADRVLVLRNGIVSQRIEK